MSTTATTVAISAAANAAAQEAARKACMVYVRGYEHDRASVSEMQEYAGCIGRLHPRELSADAMIGLKVVFAVLLVGVAVGIWRAARDPFMDGPIEKVVLGGALGLCVSGGGVLLLAGVWFGIRLLLA